MTPGVELAKKVRDIIIEHLMQPIYGSAHLTWQELQVDHQAESYHQTRLPYLMSAKERGT